MWQEPVDLLQRDLLAGPGGAALTPRGDSTYEFVAFKTTGTNPGYTCSDASGRIWSVKLGIEAQSEVTTSRILWAMGYPQPATYYLPEFTLTGTGRRRQKQQARFRTDVDPWRPGGEWSWYENPFANTQPFRGLVVAQLILNNWDLKTSNNRIYEVDRSLGDAAAAVHRPRRRLVARRARSSSRLFAMLGTRGCRAARTTSTTSSGRASSTEVEGNKVEFDYRGMNQRAGRHA